MKKLFLSLLIPALFLSSCSRVSDEADEPIQAAQMLEIPTEASPVNDVLQVSDETAPKDFWSGFLLMQNDDESTLTYNGKVVNTWSHISEKVPFVWDDACSLFFKELDRLSNERERGDDWQQTAWEQFGKDEQKKCMREVFRTNGISVQPLDDRFYKILRHYYENYNMWVYDTVSGNMHEFKNDERTWNIIESVDVTATGIVFQTARSHGDDPPVNVVFDPEFQGIQSVEIIDTLPN